MPPIDISARDKLIRAHVAAQGFMKTVGAVLDSITPGACEISVAKHPGVLQQFGMFHGGVTAFLVDNATTIAAATVMGDDQLALTAEFKLNFLSPAMGDKLICRAKVLKPGRTTSVVSADVFCVSNGKEKHTATALASIAMLDATSLPPIGPPV